MHYVPPEFKKKYKRHFDIIYPEQSERCVKRLDMMIGRYGLGLKEVKDFYEWTEQDAVLITYGDMVYETEHDKLKGLHKFLNNYVGDLFTTVHILPFFPYSSDDGFSVIDYKRVREDLGDWEEVKSICEEYRIMADVVMNHVSRQSEWFSDFLNGISPGREFFVTEEPETDLSQVVRPRSSPLLTPVQTREGKRHVWTTFSEDQIDLNFANPDVLFEFLDIIFFYISNGIRVLRLDAVAFIFKKLGTSCIHLPETHQAVKLIRELVEEVASDVAIITETNVPHKENISYFGESDEAHMVYQFSLPPLLLHAILTGNARYLTNWADGLPDLPSGCMFFNFTASHDGIGVRPIEGLVPDEDVQMLANEMQKRGGFISYKKNPDGKDSPYELNITYFDAFKEPEANDLELQIARYLCSQIIMLALRGVPGVYFQNFVGASNSRELAERSGIKRHINRKKWDYDELDALLSDETTQNAKVYQRYTELLDIRRQHPSFHPDAQQQVHQINDSVFSFTRFALDDSEAIFVVCNITNQNVEIDIADDDETVPLMHNKTYCDLLSGHSFTVVDTLHLNPYQCMWLHITD